MCGVYATMRRKHHGMNNGRLIAALRSISSGERNARPCPTFPARGAVRAGAEPQHWMLGGAMTTKRNIGTMATLGGVTAAIALLSGLPAAKADELSDLRANNQVLQQRIDQLAQIPSSGGGYLGGVPGAGVYPRPGESAGAGKASLGGSFPRSFLIPGTDTSIRVGGVIQETMDYWFSGGPTNASPQTTTLGDNGVLLATPTGGAARARSNSIFSMSPRESKVNFESRTPTPYGEARTFMEFDWVGSGTVRARRPQPDLGVEQSGPAAPVRLRHSRRLPRRPGQFELLRS